MKKISLYLLGAILFSLCSCGNKSNDPQDFIEYYPVKAESKDNWGLVGIDGEMLIENEFKGNPTAVVNGFFSVEEGNSYTLYKAGKKCDPVPGCEKLSSVGVMMEDVIPVAKKGQRITIVNSKGETLATLGPVSKKEITKTAPYFSEGLLLACNEDGKCGYVDKTGSTIIDFKYKEAAQFNEGLAIAYKEKKDYEYSYVVLNSKGEEIATLKEDITPIAEKFINGYLAAKDKDGRYGFVNKTGEFTRLSSKVKAISDYNDNYFIYINEDGESGVMSMNLENPEVIVNAKYEAINLLAGNKFIALNGKNVFVLNNKGEKEFEFDNDYTPVYYNKNGKVNFIAKDGSHYLLLDKEGKPVNKNEFSDISIDWNTGAVYSDYQNVNNAEVEPSEGYEYAENYEVEQNYEAGEIITPYVDLEDGENTLHGSFNYQGANYPFEINFVYDSTTQTVISATYVATGTGSTNRIDSMVFSPYAESVSITGPGLNIQAEISPSGDYFGTMTRGSHTGTIEMYL